jgi:hypothetical protein
MMKKKLIPNLDLVGFKENIVEKHLVSFFWELFVKPVLLEQRMC